MILQQASEADFEEVVELANLAYRDAAAIPGWNVETGIIEGSRLNEQQLRADLRAKPEALVLLYREDESGPLRGTVWVEPKLSDAFYLGLLTVHPTLQNRQIGRALLRSAEDLVRGRGGRMVLISVLNVRRALIEWYERRGYRLTGDKEAFPYGDERFGRPLRDDLEFLVLQKEL